MKLIPILIAAGVLLPWVSQSANAGLFRHVVRGHAAPHQSYYHPSHSIRSHNTYQSRYYSSRYSHRPSVGVSLNFGRSYYPAYHRYGTYGPSFGLRNGSGYGYRGY